MNIIDNTKKVGFIIPLYKDFVYFKKSLPLIRSNYPNSDIAVMCDGTGDKNIENFCNRYNTKFFNFDHSHNNNTPGRFFRNFLKISENLNFDVVIKADPDSRVYNAFLYEDFLKDHIFGTLMQSTLDRKIKYKDSFLNLIRLKFIQNGIFGIGKNIINKFKETKYFDDDIKLRERLNFFLSKGLGSPQNYKLSSELLMSIACHDLNIELYNHPEFYSIIYMKSLDIYFYNNILCHKEALENLKKFKIVHPIYE